jgi:hypothetical protein
MVKICQTGLLKLNFETRPKKRIFRFLPWMKLKIFFCQFPNPWALRVSGMGGYTSKCEKSQNHCTLLSRLLQIILSGCLGGLFQPVKEIYRWFAPLFWILSHMTECLPNRPAMPLCARLQHSQTGPSPSPHADNRKPCVLAQLAMSLRARQQHETHLILKEMYCKLSNR